MVQDGKKWLAGIGLMLLAGLAAPGYGAGLPAEVVYEDTAGGTPPAAKGERVLAKVERGGSAQKSAVSVPDSVPVMAVPDSEPVAVDNAQAPAAATAPDEKIDVIFTKPENDIMTKEAIEKLNVVIESLEFSNADLHNVIRIIGERLNINFIFDAEDISGKVTLRLHNVRLRDALNSILSSRKLAIVADQSGIFRIVPKEQVGGKTVETKTEVIQLNWISAEDIQKSLKNFITDGVGKIDYNEESNSLIITEVPPQLEIIKDLIKQIDLPERQVQIEARLADVNIGALRELGTEWSATKINDDAITKRTVTSREKSTLMGPDGSTQDTLVERVTRNSYLGDSLIGQKETVTDMLHPDAKSFTTIDNSALSTAGGLVPVLLDGFTMKGGTGKLTFGEKIGMFGSTYDLNAAFNALESRNIVEVLANPRVTTLNNVPAKISIVERIPYEQASGMSSSGTSVPTIAFEDAGVDIQVKPIITPNGYVRMEIILKQMIFRNRVGTGTLDPPQIDQRNATTNVIVKDMNTVVLGGLRQQRKQEQTSGLPWLQEVPVIGWLFKDKSVDQSKMELVLMMTPKVIEEDTGISDREKYFYDKIDNDWHLPDYFFDDVRSELDDTNADKAAKDEMGKAAEKTEKTAKKADGDKAGAKTAGADKNLQKAKKAEPAGNLPVPEVKDTEQAEEKAQDKPDNKKS